MSFNRRVFTVNASDGDERRWPTSRFYESKGKTTSKETGMTSVDSREPKFANYLTKLGKVIGEKRRVGKGVLSALPRGFKLFVADTLTKKGDERTDNYLYGHPSGNPYRSVPEFVPHILWLDGGKAGECRCGLCTSVVNSWLVETDEGLISNRDLNHRNPTFRPVKKRPSAVPRFKFPLRTRPLSPGFQASPTPDVVFPESRERTRALSCRSHFRIGELVWVPVTERTGPSSSNTAHPPLVIDRWPAIVRQELSGTGPARFKCQLIGLKTTAESYRSGKIQPFEVWVPSQANIRREIKRLARSTLPSVTEVELVKPTASFEAVKNSWSDLVFRYASAVFAANTIHEEWLTDRDSATYVQNQHRHEGIFLGAERIWIGDCVRLRAGRDRFEGVVVDDEASPSGQASMLPSLHGSEKRVPVLLVEDILSDGAGSASVLGNLYDLVYAGPTEVKQEIIDLDFDSESNSNDDNDNSGDDDDELVQTFELVIPSRPSSPATSPLNPPACALPLPPAPPGFEFRLLYPSNLRITVDLSDVFARFYPDAHQLPSVRGALSRTLNGIDLAIMQAKIASQEQDKARSATGGGRMAQLNHALGLALRIIHGIERSEKGVQNPAVEVRGQSTSHKKRRIS